MTYYGCSDNPYTAVASHSCADMKSQNETKAYSSPFLSLAKPRLIYVIELPYYMAETGELSISLL